jgi:hypothetical protein
MTSSQNVSPQALSVIAGALAGAAVGLDEITDAIGGKLKPIFPMLPQSHRVGS